MRNILSAVANESVLLLGVVSALCAAFGASAVVSRVVLAAVPFLLAVLVRSVVASPATLVQAVTDAATGAASQLTTTTVGALGVVSEAGASVLGGVVSDVVGGVGGLLPVLAHTGPST